VRVYYPRALVRVTAIVQLSRNEDDTREVTFEVRPRSVTLTRNDFNAADEAEFEFDASQFPILPRNFSNALVQVYMGDGGQIDSDDDPIAADEFLRFIGYVDDPEMSLSEDDEVIKWKARDYTALILDVRRPPASIVPAYSDLLYVALRRILDAVPGGDAIGLRLDGLDAWPRLDAGAPPGAKDAKLPVGKEDSAWHLVKRACDVVSLIPRIELDELVVGTSRGLRAPGRAVFVYGANLSTYHEKRITSRQKEGIGLRAYDMTTRQYLAAVYPPVGDLAIIKKIPRAAASRAGTKSKKVAKLPTTTGANGVKLDPNDRRKWYPWGAVSSQQELDDAAERVFLARARQEFEASFTCHEMLVPDAQDPASEYDIDVFTLSSGDQVHVDVMPEQQLVLMRFDTDDDRRQYLIDQGYAPDVADALIAAWAAGVQSGLDMYLKRAVFKIGEDGFELSAEVQNLITAEAA
jgi:hypothetical protein